jgi:hypothetical protein
MLRSELVGCESKPSQFLAPPLTSQATATLFPYLLRVGDSRQLLGVLFLRQIVQLLWIRKHYALNGRCALWNVAAFEQARNADASKFCCFAIVGVSSIHALPASIRPWPRHFHPLAHCAVQAGLKRLQTSSPPLGPWSPLWCTAIPMRCAAAFCSCVLSSTTSAPVNARSFTLACAACREACREASCAEHQCGMVSVAFIGCLYSCVCTAAWSQKAACLPRCDVASARALPSCNLRCQM